MRLTGGYTYHEQLAREARERLERDHEKHTIAKLPCCGSSIEVTDPSVDNYVQCPNKKCGKRHVILSGLSHKFKSEETQSVGTKRLLW